MNLPVRLRHLPIVVMLLAHYAPNTSSGGMADSARTAVASARQELGLLSEGHAAGVPVRLDAATLPFLAAQLQGRSAWRVDIAQPRWPSLDLPSVRALSVLLAPGDAAVVRVSSAWPDHEPPIAPYPPISVEERQLAAQGERFIRAPSRPARVSLARALAVIAANGGDLAHTRQILAYHVIHQTLLYRDREVWIVQLRGISPFAAAGLGVPEDARNHLRHIVDAQTGEWLGADTLPQPEGH
jgi:hypothetical protein